MISSQTKEMLEHKNQMMKMLADSGPGREMLFICNRNLIENTNK